MEILLLSRYENLGSSSRIRMYQYIPYLKEEGIDVIVAPLFNNDYIKKLYEKNTRKLNIVLYPYFTRLLDLTKIKKYDLLWIEKELFPMLPAWAEEIVSILKIPYIVDYDDAIFHNYDLNKNRIIRSLLKNKINKIMKNASVVIVGNEYIAERAYKARAKRIKYLPSVVDLNLYELKNTKTCNDDFFKIGWIGSPATSKYLSLIQEAFKKFYQNVKCRLIFVGAGKINISIPNLEVQIRPWSEETEVENIKDFDVGIMPLPDEPWERGKCGYKLIQYMACGIPVISSPVGVNNKIIIDGVNGFKATTIDEWVYAFKKLYEDCNLRLKMGQAGRKLVEQNYCIQVTAPKLIKIINDYNTKRRLI